ncbi:MAG: hypothetical protein JOZ52_10870 [Acidobacteria bacterium]|nr:hypothetical protein [Acidobacteriota bacterium]
MRFCTGCGSPLADAQASIAPDSSSLETLSMSPNPQTAPTNWPNFGESFKQSLPPPEPVKKGKTGLIIGLVAAVLLLGIVVIGAGAGFYFYAKSQYNNNKDEGVYKPSSEDNENANSNTNANSNATPKASVSPTPAPSPTTEQLFEPPTEPTKEASFTVYANGDWQLSPIAVVPLEEFTTNVDGLIDLAGAKAGVSPGGTKDAQYKSRRLFQEWPTGALLMRTRYADGRFSNTVAVAAGAATGAWQNLPDERGMLEFRINDNAQQGNGGQFTVHMRFTRIAKSK